MTCATMSGHVHTFGFQKGFPLETRKPSSTLLAACSKFSTRTSKLAIAHSTITAYSQLFKCDRSSAINYGNLMKNTGRPIKTWQLWSYNIIDYYPIFWQDTTVLTR